MSAGVAGADRCINVTFRGVGEPTRELAAGDEQVWISSEQFVSTLDAVRGRDDARLSVDDGKHLRRPRGVALLQRRGLRATSFVVAGRLGVAEFLAADDVRALCAAGMTIGCHGTVHLPWRRLDVPELRDEMLVPMALEAIVGGPVTQAACPVGSYDRRVLRSLRAYGYRRVFKSDGGPAEPDGWLQARTSLGPPTAEDRLATSRVSTCPGARRSRGAPSSR